MDPGILLRKSFFFYPTVSRLTDLIAQAKLKDPQIGADLEREFKALSSRLSFGLNFERHRPEAVELPQRPIRKGDKVRILPERGSTKKGDQRLWLVRSINKTAKKKTAELELLGSETAERQTALMDDLVVVAEFKDKIYPGLITTGKIQRGKDKPFHTVINSENYHALKALTYTHRGKVDVIYIDPPYNTGAKDWKYNNDYVEGDDLYRHSKWLAMMERRLLIAKELLNPADSVLIVTIDEKEYLRLGLLLEQIFPEAQMQMVSVRINPSGIARGGEFRRSDEYLFVLRIGASVVMPAPLGPDWEFEQKRRLSEDLEWNKLRRTGTNTARTDRPNLFYPLFISPKTETLVGVGEPIPLSAELDVVKAPEGAVAVWPIRSDGSHGNWQIGPDALKAAHAKGYVRLGKPNKRGYAVYYLKSGEQRKVESGFFLVTGRRKDGSIMVSRGSGESRGTVPTTQWASNSHDAATHGSRLLLAMLSGRKFPFPKSLYAVEDCLRFFVIGKPHAVILDFFAGSGTTAHAVMRLNRQDGGHRHCISITNNEVASSEQKGLRQKGLRPGDGEWEKLGICDHITKPRVAAAITGNTPEGEPVKGDYRFRDEFPMTDGFEENAEFFTLTYETPVAVSHSMAFSRIAPLLWLRAGSRGKRIDKLPAAGWEVADSYGLLLELDRAAAFLKALRKAKGIRIAYIVTDDDRRFQSIAQRLPEGIEAVRLYESYLTNFAFTNGD